MRYLTLQKAHVWLGWCVGIPLLLWTVTGLWMVSQPIEDVRGVHLKETPPALTLNNPPIFPALPADHGAPLSVRLEQQWDGTFWIATFRHGHEMRAAAIDGKWMPAITERQARDIAERWYKPVSHIESVLHTPATAPPIDLRKERPAWGVNFADGARVYIDADTGGLLAIRSGQWRIFDFMWGLHIMDLESREDTHHPILIGFAALAALSIILALILLPMTKLLRRKGLGRKSKRNYANRS